MSKIIGRSLPNIPWQEKPEGYTMPVWRYTENPIIGRSGNKVSNSVFNSAVVPFEDGFAGVFRCDSRSISMDIFVGRSKDGIHWDIEDTPIQFEGEDEEILKENTATIQESVLSRTDITSHGATDTTVRPSVLPIHLILKSLCS